MSWSCRIYQLHLCRSVRPHPSEGPRNDPKQSDGEALVMLELWRVRSTPLLPSLPGPLLSGVVAPDKVLLIGQMQLFDI